MSQHVEWGRATKLTPHALVEPGEITDSHGQTNDTHAIALSQGGDLIVLEFGPNEAHVVARNLYELAEDILENWRTHHELLRQP